jgi:hypothetical protein
VVGAQHPLLVGQGLLMQGDRLGRAEVLRGGLDVARRRSVM